MRCTYSLRWLLLSVTLVCVALGVLANFPQSYRHLPVASILVVPGLATASLLAAASSWPRSVLVLSMLGWLVGCILSPTLLPSLDRLPAGLDWDREIHRLQTEGIITAWGAAAFGMAAILYFDFWRLNCNAGRDSHGPATRG